MTDVAVVQIAVQAIMISAKLAAPILVVTLAIGLGISILQSVTQIQEVTLTFVPKLVGVGVVILASGHWMLREIIAFTQTLFNELPSLLG
jgi:flagellar biosynthetic protein FliQ